MALLLLHLHFTTATYKMFKVQSTVRVGGLCVCVCYLAEECGLELCCGVAGVKKLTKGNLEEKEGEICKVLYCSCYCNTDCINIAFHF